MSLCVHPLFSVAIDKIRPQAIKVTNSWILLAQVEPVLGCVEAEPITGSVLGAFTSGLCSAS